MPSAGARRAAAAVTAGEAELSAWRAAAVTAVLSLALVLAAASVLYVLHQRRKAAGARQAPSCAVDVERGESSAVADAADGNSSKRPASGVSVELRQALRELMNEEIFRALQRSDMSGRLEQLERREEISVSLERASISDRLERLERQLTAAGEASRLMADNLDSCPRSPPHRFDVPAPPVGEPPGMSSGRVRSLCDATCGTDPEPLLDFGQNPRRRRTSGRVPDASFGPTRRQLRRSEPPEKASFHLDEGSALQQSMAILRRQAHKRDGQAAELEAQIESCQRLMRDHAASFQRTTRKLETATRDPASTLQLQAELIAELRRRKEDLAERLQATGEAEARWSMLARCQRAYFVQSDRLAHEGAMVIRRYAGGDPFVAHPAGDLALASPPLAVESSDADLPWDIANAVMNPYATDSWPFEPNVLAARRNFEPSLGRLDETGDGASESGLEDDDDDDDDAAELDPEGEDEEQSKAYRDHVGDGLEWPGPRFAGAAGSPGGDSWPDCPGEGLVCSSSET
eukprot:TRINITY_DN6259_c0_g1_i1.p1 TRINITY_DN6259_c0_g1~~TRINITY_DN6259_c0_g1_i1.p1  ORF type:complete len:517 (+),score=99.36 TRINITY_DN6259_c0_g1_i1:126-1676(+)